jgi:hypothetical protein
MRLDVSFPSGEVIETATLATDLACASGECPTVLGMPKENAVERHAAVRYKSKEVVRILIIPVDLRVRMLPPLCSIAIGFPP